MIRVIRGLGVFGSYENVVKLRAYDLAVIVDPDYSPVQFIKETFQPDLLGGEHAFFYKPTDFQTPGKEMCKADLFSSIGDIADVRFVDTLILRYIKVNTKRVWENRNTGKKNTCYGRGDLEIGLDISTPSEVLSCLEGFFERVD